MRRLSTIIFAGVTVSYCPALGFTAPLKSAKLPLSQSIRTEFLDRNADTRLSSVPPGVWTNFLPPMMGFAKSEWAVSYGYGFATSLSALLLLLRQETLPSSLVSSQAAALVFYGLRLNIFLFLRNRLSPRYREIGKRIEKQSRKRNPNRISRWPFVISCGFLYYGLYTPVLLSWKLIIDVTAKNSTPASAIVMNAMKILIGLQWFGYIVAAVGDFTKSYVKMSEKNGSFLVTSGIFSLLRHPNFTGEILSWTSNALCGIVAATNLLRREFSFQILSYLGISLLGWAGIVFVLLRATGNLEERQKKDYGDTGKYTKWVNSTWSGWSISSSANINGSLDEPHEI